MMLEILPFAPAREARYFPEKDSRRKPVVITGETSERLRTEAVEALRSLPRRGLEIGGVLLGTAGESLTVRDLAPVESEHLYGPRYEQSERDRANFKAKVAELRNSGPDVPIGLYRTFTLEGGGMDARDEEAVRQYFPERDGLFVLAFPKLSGRTEISCFYWDQRSLNVCPLVPGSPIEKAAELQPAPERRELQEAEVRVNGARKPASKRVQWVNELVLAATAGLIVLAAVALMHSKSAASSTGHTETAAAVRPLGARVEFTPDGALLAWDGTSQTIRNSAGALLSVKDGANTIELPITASELQTGSILYGAANPRAIFDLVVFAPEGGETKQSITGHASAAPLRQSARSTRHRAFEKSFKPVRPRAELPQSWALPPPVTNGSGSIVPHE